MESSSFKRCQGGSRPTVLQSLLMVLRSQVCTTELCLQAERREAEAQLGTDSGCWGRCTMGITCRGLGGGGVMMTNVSQPPVLCGKRSRQMNLLSSFPQTGRPEGGNDHCLICSRAKAAVQQGKSLGCDRHSAGASC